MASKAYDFDVTCDGSVYVFTAKSEDALAHVVEYVQPEPWQWLGAHAFAVDHRIAPDLALQLREDGWSVVAL